MIIAGSWYALCLLPLVLILIGLLVRALVLTKRVVERVSSPAHRARVLHHFSLAKVYMRTGCMIGALILLWLAALRIQYESHEKKPSYEQGRDLLIALDISRSMLAQDYQPSRLHAAKAKIKTLLQALSAERVGLLVFSGSALVQCPLTKDFEAFELFLDAIDAESMTEGTTDIASALYTAAHLFEQNPERKNKLLVVVTDGEDFSIDLAAMQKKAVDLGMRVCALGMATPEGAPIPTYDQDGKLQGHIRDAAGAVVMSRLHEPTLKKLATELSGIYLRADKNSDADVDRLCAWLATFDKEQFATTDRATYKETFIYYAAAALACVLIGRFL